MESFRRYILRTTKEKNPQLAKAIEEAEELNLMMFYFNVWILEVLLDRLKDIGIE